MKYINKELKAQKELKYLILTRVLLKDIHFGEFKITNIVIKTNNIKKWSFEEEELLKKELQKISEKNGWMITDVYDKITKI